MVFVVSRFVALEPWALWDTPEARGTRRLAGFWQFGVVFTRRVIRGMRVAPSVGHMLKITPVDAKPQTLRLEGDVSGPWVAELRRVCFDTLGHGPDREGHLVLDLAGVSFLDVDGIALFRDLARQQVLFTSRSLFIAEQLKGVSDVDR